MADTKVSFGGVAPSFTSVSAEAVDAPSGDDTHQCEVCGTEVYRPSGRGRWPRYCEEHKAAGNRDNTAATGDDKVKRNTGGGKKKAATQDQWTQFLTMGLLMSTYCIGRFAAGGQGVLLSPPPGMTESVLDDMADSLGMEPEEAAPIAKLIAKRATPSSLNKKYGHLIVNAMEYEEIGSALWAYGRRIGPVLAERIQSPSRGQAAARKVQPPAQPRETRVVHEQTTAQASASPGHVPTNAEIVAAAVARQRQQAPPNLGDDERS